MAASDAGRAQRSRSDDPEQRDVGAAAASAETAQPGDETPPAQTDDEAGAGTPDEPDVELSLDSIFFTLSNSRRRWVIHCLKRTDEPIEVGHLSRLVAAVENDVSPEAVTYHQRKRVYTSLHQLHLPKMDDLGVVEYDQRSGTVRPAGGLAELDIYLEVVPGGELSWSEFYLGLGLLSLAVAALVALNVFPFGLLPSVAYLGIFSIALVVAGAAHWRHGRSQSFPDELDAAVLEHL